MKKKKKQTKKEKKEEEKGKKEGQSCSKQEVKGVPEKRGKTVTENEWSGNSIWEQWRERR